MKIALIVALGLLPVSALASEARAEPCEAPHIQAHLAQVERELLAADVSGLTAAQRASRARHIEALRAYRERCVFPHNTAWADRVTPLFVDGRGVHCAVGQLMAEDGLGPAVERIRAHHNTASIQELAGDPEVSAWLAESGLTWAEAARIQPSYCFYQRSSCLCGPQVDLATPAPYVIEGFIVTAGISGSRPSTLRITRIHGAGATSVVGDIIDASALPGDFSGRLALVVPTNQDSRDRTSVDLKGGVASCQSGSFGDTAVVTVPTDIYVAALMSQDCPAALAAYDPNMNLSVCDELPKTDEGCAGSGATGPWALLLALTLLVALRRREVRG